MAKYDEAELKLLLEAMKLSQSSLQQLMTLSAGGLAIYFGFISKAQFLEPARGVGVVVVICWIVSLCAALLAHHLHANLFRSLINLSRAVARIDELEALTQTLDNELARAVDRAAARAQRLTEFDRDLAEIKDVTGAFKRTFPATQARVHNLTALALTTLLVGFGALAVAFVVWLYTDSVNT